MASRSVNQENRSKTRGDSPITVGGGGGRKGRGRRAPFYMEIIFNHADYIPDAEDQSNFVNPTLTLDRVLINNQPAMTASNPATVVLVNGESEVVIKYKKSGAIRPKIVINGGPFGVSFKGCPPSL